MLSTFYRFVKFGGRNNGKPRFIKQVDNNISFHMYFPDVLESVEKRLFLNTADE